MAELKLPAITPRIGNIRLAIHNRIALLESKTTANAFNEIIQADAQLQLLYQFEYAELIAEFGITIFTKGHPDCFMFRADGSILTASEYHRDQLIADCG